MHCKRLVVAAKNYSMAFVLKVPCVSWVVYWVAKTVFDEYIYHKILIFNIFLFLFYFKIQNIE